MRKNFEKTNGKAAKHDGIVYEVVDLFGLMNRQISSSTVKKVRDGVRNNEEVFDAYMTMREALDDAKNNLLKAAEKAVPFNK